jgi:RNA polymerase sigma-70 factor (ECF subfamily)
MMWLLAALAGFRPESAEAQAQDREWLSRLSAGDGDAAAALYDRHSRAIYSLVLRILEDEGDAEDVVQDVFAQAWRQVARYDAARGAVGAWLLVMARTRAIDRLRSRRARSGPQMVDERAMEGLASGGPDAASEIIDAEQARRVQRALG